MIVDYEQQVLQEARHDALVKALDQIGVKLDDQLKVDYARQLQNDNFLRALGQMDGKLKNIESYLNSIRFGMLWIVGIVSLAVVHFWK